MCDQQSPKSRDDTALIEPQQVTVDHLRRAADSWRGLSDPELMANAWDESATRGVPAGDNLSAEIRPARKPYSFREL